MTTLRRMRVNLSTSRGGSSGAVLGKGFRSNFLRGSKKAVPSPKRPRCSWTHRFFCLSQCDQDSIPTTDREKDALLEAGLGEKKVCISDIDATADDFRSVMFEAYPKLKNAGGFLFAKGRSNSRSVELLSSLCLTSPRILRDRVGNSRTYIIPLQRDLDMSPVCQLPDGVSEVINITCRA